MSDTKTRTCQVCSLEFEGVSGKERFCKDCGMFTQETFKAAAQLKKAIKLSVVVIAAGGQPHDIHTIPLRRLAEQAAGVPESSDTTWALVAVLMAGGK